MRSVALVSLAILALVSCAEAREFRSIRQTVADGNKELTFPLIRCSGFFLAYEQLIGLSKKPKNQDMAKDAGDKGRFLRQVAANTLAANKGGKPEDYRYAVETDTGQARDAYRSHMLSLVPNLDNDPLLDSDTNICKRVLESLTKK